MAVRVIREAVENVGLTNNTEGEILAQPSDKHLGNGGKILRPTDTHLQNDETFLAWRSKWCEI